MPHVTLSYVTCCFLFVLGFISYGWGRDWLKVGSYFVKYPKMNDYKNLLDEEHCSC